MEAETAPAQRQGGSYTRSYTVEVAGRNGWRGQRGGGYGIEGEGDGCVTPWAGTDEEPTPFEFLQLSIQTMLNVTLAEVRAHPLSPHPRTPQDIR